MRLLELSGSRQTQIARYLSLVQPDAGRRSRGIYLPKGSAGLAGFGLEVSCEPDRDCRGSNPG